MNRCSSSSHGNMVGGPCTCGVFHSQSNSFSMLFPKDFDEQEADMYSFTSSSSSSSSSSVDCTLSLGTPSTRSRESAEKLVHHHDRLIPSFCWDILQSKRHAASTPPTHNKASRGSGGGDSLLARRCANCDTTSTPLWRNGPRGPKSLCNACGIRFKKEERRATATAAAAATITTTTASGGAASAIMDSHQRMLNNSSWDQHHHQQSQKMPCFSPAIGNEFRFINADSDRDIDTSIPFLSWHRNITDRPSLVHGFTR